MKKALGQERGAPHLRCALIPEWIFHLGLSPHAFAVYAVLLLHRNKHSGKAWPNWKTLSGLAGVGKDTLAKKLDELESQGLILRGKRKGRFGSVRYLLPLREIPKSPTSVEPSNSEKSEYCDSDNQEPCDSENRESCDSETSDENQEEGTRKKGTNKTSSVSFGEATIGKGEEEGNPSVEVSSGRRTTQSNPKHREPWQPSEIQKRLSRMFEIDRNWSKRENDAYAKSLASLKRELTTDDLDLLEKWAEARPEAQLNHFAAYLQRLPDQLKRARKAMTPPTPSLEPSGNYRRGETFKF